MWGGSGVGGKELCHRSESRPLRWGTVSVGARLVRPQGLGKMGPWDHAKSSVL